MNGISNSLDNILGVLVLILMVLGLIAALGIAGAIMMLINMVRKGPH